jgi:UPF0176 protein
MLARVDVAALVALPAYCAARLPRSACDQPFPLVAARLPALNRRHFSSSDGGGAGLAASVGPDDACTSTLEGTINRSSSTNSTTTTTSTTNTTGSVLNVIAYRFTHVPDANALRAAILERGQAAQVLGTVLIAEEGLNLALAGSPQPLRHLLDWLQQWDAARFADLPVKESFSAQSPFHKLVVKIKPEIIRMNRHATTAAHPHPADGRAPAVTAQTLARWLAQGRHDDDGRPVVLLDTRNDLEVDVGAFEGAVDWRLSRFSDFPTLVEARAGELVGKTVVTYCTGGIRCEKAALVVMAALAKQEKKSKGDDDDAGGGLSGGADSGRTTTNNNNKNNNNNNNNTRVYQLDGGILRYFEDTNGVAPGWHGDCAVFDDRRALQRDLTPAVVVPSYW